MEYKIPPFPTIGTGDTFPGDLSTEDASRLERIHKHLRADISTGRDQSERLICKAVQQCYDILTRSYSQRSSLSGYVLEEALPELTLNIAIDCRWLPPEARGDSPEWRVWVHELVAGRFSQVAIEEADEPDSFLIIPFPDGVGIAKGPTAQRPVESAAPLHGDKLSKGKSTDNEATHRKAVITPILKGKGWSVLDWALASGVDYKTASDYLNGKKDPFTSTRKKLADSLGLSPDTLPS